MPINAKTPQAFAETSVHPRPAHHSENGFRNPYPSTNTASLSDSSSQRKPSFMLRIKKMRRFYAKMRAEEKKGLAQSHLVPRVNTNLENIHNPQELPQLTWIGHSTVLIQYQGINIITDPIFSGYCGPAAFLAPKRITPPAIDIKQLPPIDFVLISHNHYDHLDLATVRHLRNAPLWLVPLGIKAWLERVGVDAARVVELDWWEDYRVSSTLLFTATPAQHWSRRTLSDHNRTLWSSWHVSIDNFHLWFAGDTGYNEHQFVAIGERLPHADIALIPIGAYQPRQFMQTSHVNPYEAVKIFQDVKAHKAIGVHWGTFNLSAEGLLTPTKDLRTAVQAANLRTDQFEAPILGRTFTVLPSAVPLKTE